MIAPSEITFNVENDPPFTVSKILRAIAVNSVGEQRVLDLSQGEPGYGFSPSILSRHMYVFMTILDIEFNNLKYTNTLAREHLYPVLTDNLIHHIASNYFSVAIGNKLARNFIQLLKTIRRILHNQNVFMTRDEIVHEFFKYSNLSGGKYPDPDGSLLYRVVMANEYSKKLGMQISYNDLIPVAGASHGVSTVVKALGTEGIGYLREGDTVLSTTPVYEPFIRLFKERNIELLSIAIDKTTGKHDEASADLFLSEHNSKHIKLIFLVNPNNPTGFAADRSFLAKIDKISKKHNAIILTDEVYSSFFGSINYLSEFSCAKQRWIRIDAISKIERATGLRIGDIFISKGANTYITENILGKSRLLDHRDLRSLLISARSHGGINMGLFRHIAGPAGPSVVLAMLHTIYGKEERAHFVQEVQENMVAFYEALGIPYKGNCYFGIIDLSDIESSCFRKMSVERKLARLARRGVVVMPANKFFSDEKSNSASHLIRVSLPNLSRKNVRLAATIVKRELSAPFYYIPFAAQPATDDKPASNQPDVLRPRNYSVPHFHDITVSQNNLNT